MIRHLKFLARKPIFWFYLILFIDAIRVSSRSATGDFEPIMLALRRVSENKELYKLGIDHPEYVYSPIFITLLYPLHYLNQFSLRFFWYVISCLSIFGSLKVSAYLGSIQSKDDTHKSKNYWIISLAALWYVCYYNVLNGQATPLILFLTLSAFAIEYHSKNPNKSLYSALCLAGALSIKPFPLIFFPLFSLSTLAICFGALLISFIGSSLFLQEGPITLIKSWISINKEQQTIYDITDWGHQSVFSLWWRIFGMTSKEAMHIQLLQPSTICIATTLIMLVIGYLFVIKRDKFLGLLFGLCLWTLLPPTAWKHYYITLLTPVLFFVSQWRDGFTVNLRQTFQYLKDNLSPYRMGIWILIIGNLLQYVRFGGERHYLYRKSWLVFAGLAFCFAIFLKAYKKANPSDSSLKDSKINSLSAGKGSVLTTLQ